MGTDVIMIGNLLLLADVVCLNQLPQGKLLALEWLCSAMFRKFLRR